MTRAAAGVVAIVALLSACAQEPSEPADPAQPTDTAAVDHAAQTISWEACGDAECAQIVVPLDYDEPDGDTVTLPLLRHPARYQDNRIGSLLINPGGPGASGVEFARFADARFGEDVLAVYDVVGFDPRGVAGSMPAIDCVDDTELAEFLDGEATPDTPASVAEFVSDGEAFVEACIERSGDLLDHVGTDDVARDLDLMREVLGDDLLYYLGFSYGTSIGSEYVRQFPERVGRVVLDGVTDPALDATGFALGQAEGMERALSAFAQECAARSCSLGSTPEAVRSAVQRVMEQAADEPIPSSEGPALTEAAAFRGILHPLYQTADEWYPFLEAAVGWALQGDGALLVDSSDLYLRRAADGSFSGNNNEAIGPINCADRGGTGSVADVEAALPDYEAASPTFGEAMAWNELGCEAWPDSDQVSPGPVAGEGAPPILVVGTTGDLATPYEWAQSLADQLSSGVLLTYDSTPHTAYGQGSGCIDRAVEEYLLSGTPPPAGTICR